MSQRITWIDCWKGIAIVTVVAGHILDSNIARYIFWFHMPLFFFISGYLYKEKYDYSAFFKKKFIHLIIPYISFLILFSLPTLATHIYDIWQAKTLSSVSQLFSFTWKQFYGGEILTGRFGVFWFVTCLFFTQQLYNFLYTKFQNYPWLMNIIMLNTYCLAMVDYLLFADILFLWNINVVLMALPFYWLGHIASQKPNFFNKKWLSKTALITFITMALIEKLYFLDFTFDMKYKNYGVPIINLLIAISGIIVIHQIAKSLNKITLLDSIIREIGAASMIIMYLHQPIQLGLNKISFLSEDIIRLTISLLIPYIIYKIIINFPITRKFFLGELNNFSKIKPKALSKV